jgi:hypothetical protein
MTSKKRNYQYIQESGYHFISRSFSSSEELNEVVRRWDVEFNQLDHGQFRCDLIQIDGKVQVSKVSLNQKIDQNGSAPKGRYSIVIPVKRNTSFIWRNHNITENCIPVFPPGSELHAVSDKSFEVFIISLPLDLSNSLSHEQHLPELKDLFDSKEVVVSTPAQIDIIRNRLHQIILVLHQNPQNLLNTNLLYEIEHTLPAMLLNTISDSRVKMEHSAHANHTKAIKQIKNEIFDRSGEIIHIEDLQRVTGYSKRALEYIFKDYYGISPHAYLKKIRLNKV